MATANESKHSEAEQPQDDETPVDLTTDEIKEAEERAMPRAAIVYETIRREGKGELERTSGALAFSALSAGLSMGFSFFGMSTIYAFLPDAPWRTLIAGAGYSIGFLITILGRQQLFTENTLTPILVLLGKFEAPTLWKVTRLWLIVLLGNVVGAFAFAEFIAHAPVLAPPIMQAFHDLAHESAQNTGVENLVRAVFAGWIIALMVWLLPAAESGAMFIILLLTGFVGSAQLAHIVAGSVENFYGVAVGIESWSDFWLKFFLPTLAGNCIGGVTFVALLNFAQVAGDTSPREKQAS
jgi:formate/nitrite transporter FocA (FNT family)